MLPRRNIPRNNIYRLDTEMRYYRKNFTFRIRSRDLGRCNKSSPGSRRAISSREYKRLNLFARRVEDPDRRSVRSDATEPAGGTEIAGAQHLAASIVRAARFQEPEHDFAGRREGTEGLGRGYVVVVVVFVVEIRVVR